MEKKEMSDIEKRLEQIEKRKTVIQSEFESGTLPNDRIVELSKELGELNNELDEKEMRWLELSEFL